MNPLELGIITLIVLFALPLVMQFVIVPMSLVHEVRARRRRRLPSPAAASARVSIVVPAYNEERVLANCLNSILLHAAPNAEIIVVDDGSSDRTFEIAQCYTADPRVTAITKPNGGKGSALNAGYELTTGDIILFVDADGVFTAETIPEMLRTFHHSRVGAVCGDDRPMNLDRIQVRFLAIVAHLGTGMVRRALAQLRCLTIVSGNSGAFRREALDEVAVPRHGVFRTDTIGEDLELTWRIRRAGWQVEFAPFAVVLAESPSTLLGLWKQRVRWARGLLQTLDLHWDAVGNLRYGTFGTFLIYNMLTMVVLPVVVVTALATNVILAGVLVGYGVSPFVMAPDAGWLWVLAGEVAVVLGLVTYAALLDRSARDLRHAPMLVLWPFYSVFFSLTMVRAIFLQLGDAPVKWNKLERTAVNSYAAPALVDRVGAQRPPLVDRVGAQRRIEIPAVA
ncbi:glycosyltransferase family 2 protein [Gulosibacter macacae]|uniref:Glycosyltransferase family 2 protein n=1 Tax=Gulosibacter macacae TaxID=2488791 RepID=A0A3P3VW47_9MICO|nr:glycosyltransferase family 2 protein [Gulosibacter macacae]RRJ87015.1 glycosyltransferase family 2 protein [Gulosibacter macacae]